MRGSALARAVARLGLDEVVLCVEGADAARQLRLAARGLLGARVSFAVRLQEQEPTAERVDELRALAARIGALSFDVAH